MKERKGWRRACQLRFVDCCASENSHADCWHAGNRFRQSKVILRAVFGGEVGGGSSAFSRLLLGSF